MTSLKVVLTEAALTDLDCVELVTVAGWARDARGSNTASLCPVSPRVQPFGGGEEGPRVVRQQRPACHGRVSAPLPFLPWQSRSQLDLPPREPLWC